MGCTICLWLRYQPFFRLPAGYGTIDFRGNLVYYLNGISD